LERASRHDAEDKPAEIARGHETILVVEDENDVRDLACEFLTMTGYSVLRARNGVEAIDLLRRHPGKIDLVLSDVVMPKMGGSELAVRLPDVRPGTKILLMSGYSEYAVESQNEGRPQHPMLSKPFSRSTLIAKIREALAAPAVAPQTEPAPVKSL
jgi:CheY-like chemotaxis protein